MGRSELKSNVNLGEFDAAGLDPQARQYVVTALGENENIVTVSLKKVDLSLEKGWKTTSLDFSNNAAVRALPATVSLLLANCNYLTALDLRYICMDKFLKGASVTWFELTGSVIG
jgi:hypothetical protein